MSTRSQITALCGDGKWRSIYVHFDGYPTGVGKTLVKNYTDQDKVDKPVELGNLSELLTIPVPQNPKSGPGIGSTAEEAFRASRMAGQEYFYEWHGTEWLIYDADSMKPRFIPVSEILLSEES